MRTMMVRRRILFEFRCFALVVVEEIGERVMTMAVGGVVEVEMVVEAAVVVVVVIAAADVAADERVAAVAC